MSISTSRLRYAAGALALLVAGIHLLHPSVGGFALLVYLQVGYLGDPRPLLFTLGAFALLFGVFLGYYDLDDRRVYLGGIALALSFLLGFVAWHAVLGHGGFWPHIQAYGHTEDPVGTVFDHLVADALTFVSKLAEFALVVVLAELYRRAG